MNDVFGLNTWGLWTGFGWNFDDDEETPLFSDPPPQAPVRIDEAIYEYLPPETP